MAVTFHHPALAQTGELEIAQREALHAGLMAADKVGYVTTHDQVVAAVDAYLKSMASYVPGPIVIGEGDHIIVQAGEGGQTCKVEVERDRDGDLRLSLDNGDEIHYPTGAPA